MIWFHLWAQTPAPAAPNPLISFLPMVAIFFIFYFLLIRPQKKTQSDHRKMVAALKKNDEIVTTGGMHGTVLNVKDTTLVIRVDDNAKIEIDKDAVGRVTKQRGES